jgi:flavin reductase (DIM6/NTAB) family NADH-FMN oxidoreductase RutF
MTSTTSKLTPAELRAVLGRVPTGVLVVTTPTPAGQFARTANSFASVSLDPPLVSVCFGIRSRLTAAMLASERWAVSVLAADQHHLSRHFADPATAADLSAVPHRLGANTAAALLTESLASLECRTATTHPAGDHILFIGEVLSLCPHRDTAPLVFHLGAYHAGPPPNPTTAEEASHGRDSLASTDRASVSASAPLTAGVAPVRST